MARVGPQHHRKKKSYYPKALSMTLLEPEGRAAISHILLLLPPPNEK